MGSRFPSHQLSNGLYVSGRPEQPKERPPTMTNSVNRVSSVSASGVSGSASLKKTNSGPLNRHGKPIKKSSGPHAGGTSVSRQNSGPLAPVLPTTGLITSGPISSGLLNSSGAPRKASGPLDSTGSVKLHNASIVHNQAVTNLSQEEEYSFRTSFPKPILWAMVLLFVMGFIAGSFILGAVHNPILLVVVVVHFWCCCCSVHLEYFLGKKSYYWLYCLLSRC